MFLSMDEKSSEQGNITVNDEFLNDCYDDKISSSMVGNVVRDDDMEYRESDSKSDSSTITNTDMGSEDNSGIGDDSNVS